MPRFFTDTIDEAASRAVVAGEDARHIVLSLRMREGDALTVCDGRGRDYECAVARAQRECVELTILSSSPSRGEPPVAVTLFQALPKGDKFEFIVQKSVELGVGEIVPLLSARCVSRPDEKSWHKKRERYSRIAAEAAKQCGRGILPAVKPLMEIADLPEKLADFDACLLFYERSERKLRSIPLSRAHKLAVIIGAEGGFERQEADLLIRAGAVDASLGSRILRCETAPIAALAALWYAVGEM